jgi:hypothetical protein
MRQTIALVSVNLNSEFLPTYNTLFGSIRTDAPDVDLEGLGTEFTEGHGHGEVFAKRLF